MKALKSKQKMKLAGKASSRGQAALEFALVFPILILVVVGLLEAGRLIFIYGSVVTASREAARYGSTAGKFTPEDPTVNDYFYQHCEGIVQRARDVTFLTNDADLTVTIEYDSGPGTSVYESCVDTDGDGFDSGVVVSPKSTAVPCSEDTPCRILVTVSTVYTPLVPVVLPQLTTFTIETTSARTFLGVVEYWPQ